MPDQFIKFPRVESIQYFESAMYGHNKVLRCKKISDSYYEIQREDLPPIFVFVSNYYALSVSDYYEITSEYQIDCLVTISNWNRNIKQYLLAALYNAPLTISNYYQAMYNNDHANGLV